jgi:hypothetical protein
MYLTDEYLKGWVPIAEEEEVNLMLKDYSPKSSDKYVTNDGFH